MRELGALSCTLVVLAGLSAGCATSGGSRESAATESRDGGAPKTATEKLSRITWSGEEQPLGAAIRELGRFSGQGLVVMNGLEHVLVGPFEFQDEPIESVIEEIAREARCEVATTDTYFFVYPTDSPAYAALTELSVEGMLEKRYRAMTADAAFGADTPLYSVLTLLSRALDITVVADNVVADSECGELALREAPLEVILEALLKSARVHGPSVEIRSTPEFIFIRGTQNTPRSGPLLLNAAVLDPHQRATLSQQVSISLPHPSDGAQSREIEVSAIRLGRAVDELSRQMGVRVRVEAELAELPVNPVVMNDVRIETAMELLIRQWPVPEFGFEMTAEGIVIRHAGGRRPS